jgi:hypothetical protein
MREDNTERHLKALPAISSLRLHKSLANYLEIQKPNSTFLEDVKEAKREAEDEVEATTILPLLSDFLFCRSVLTPLAVVVGLKADGVAGARNDLVWGCGLCVWCELFERRSFPFQQSFFSQLQLQPRGVKLCSSHSEAWPETEASAWLISQLN